MNFPKIFYGFVFGVASLLVNAQDIKEKIAIEGGYTYFNRSFADVGVKFAFDRKFIVLGGNALVGASNGKLLVIPEINATKYFEFKKNDLPFAFVRFNVSPKTVSPQVGFSYFFIEFGVGYGFSFDKSIHYRTEGFRTQLNINIPLKFNMRIM
ncbi:hypothetical protein [Riemerella anatipestifer]|uniref:Outer membrane protein beta-barrel domain-containing protein n=1 Tax=Riemerella anatipestifer TaxID=34085 RepID=A0A1S7DVW4_RIEAN|nr:hypothetical protein [Riemerella anatipestifer]AQY23257.1 hypothetical protein AB406_2326 [Riemerella anatipestifer]MCO4304120.1 hypothetical protein [Riemerella anatipestifer]MCO7352980.1 hypothetical protein [Riemerella anatipestifer]MCQ4039497.1 hypothetical protein [Riemerella anatipestifer]MCT6761182.1 hypothetical protein [Riemerella anatipestifer]